MGRLRDDQRQFDLFSACVGINNIRDNRRQPFKRRVVGNGFENQLSHRNPSLFLVNLCRVKPDAKCTVTGKVAVASECRLLRLTFDLTRQNTFTDMDGVAVD